MDLQLIHWTLVTLEVPGLRRAPNKNYTTENFDISMVCKMRTRAPPKTFRQKVCKDNDD